MKRLLSVLFLLAFVVPQAQAQRYKDARSYYREFQSTNRKISAKNMRYTEAVARGDDARRVNKFREMVISQLKDSHRVITRVGSFNDDAVLHKEYLGALDMFIEAFEVDFGAADELTKNRFNSYQDLQAYYAAANAAEIKVLDASYKIEKAEDYFAKKYTVDLRRDTVMQAKFLGIDEMTVYMREVTLTYFRVDADLQHLFNAIDAGQTDSLSDIITNLRRSAKTAMLELEGINAIDGYEDVIEQALYFFEEVNGSIDKDLRPMAEVFEFKYKDQDDLAEAQETLADFKAFHKNMRADYFETRSALIMEFIEEYED
jgi:hypothetical protein